MEKSGQKDYRKRSLHKCSAKENRDRKQNVDCEKSFRKPF